MIKHYHERESSQTISSKKQIWIASVKSHLTFRDTTQNTLSAYSRSNSHQYSLQQANSHQKKLTSLYSSQQWFVYRISSSRAKRERLLRAKKLIIVMFSKRSNSQTKRLFSFIIACYSKSLNTIQSFREVKRRNRLTLKDFHHIFQDVIAARQKDFELDSDYNSFSFKLSSSVISSQFFRKSTLDSSSDIDLFDLKVRSFSSLNRHVLFKQFTSKQIVSSSRTQSLCNYERKYQNDLFIRDNAIERFFRVSNMTERNEKSANSYESLTLRRDRECRVIRFSFNFSHFREASQDQNKQSQSRDDYEKSIEMQRQESSERRDQCEKCVKNSEELVQLVRIKDVKRFADQALNYHFRQQSKRHELRSTIQNDNAEHSKNDYQRVDQW